MAEGKGCAPTDSAVKQEPDDNPEHESLPVHFLDATSSVKDEAFKNEPVFFEPQFGKCETSRVINNFEKEENEEDGRMELEEGKKEENEKDKEDKRMEEGEEEEEEVADVENDTDDDGESEVEEIDEEEFNTELALKEGAFADHSARTFGLAGESESGVKRKKDQQAQTSSKKLKVCANKTPSTVQKLKDASTARGGLVDTGSKDSSGDEGSLVSDGGDASSDSVSSGVDVDTNSGVDYVPYPVGLIDSASAVSNCMLYSSSERDCVKPQKREENPLLKVDNRQFSGYARSSYISKPAAKALPSYLQSQRVLDNDGDSKSLGTNSKLPSRQKDGFQLDKYKVCDTAAAKDEHNYLGQALNFQMKLLRECTEVRCRKTNKRGKNVNEYLKAVPKDSVNMVMVEGDSIVLKQLRVCQPEGSDGEAEYERPHQPKRSGPCVQTEEMVMQLARLDAEKQAAIERFCDDNCDDDEEGDRLRQQLGREVVKMVNLKEAFRVLSPEKGSANFTSETKGDEDVARAQTKTAVKAAGSNVSNVITNELLEYHKSLVSAKTEQNRPSASTPTGTPGTQFVVVFPKNSEEKNVSTLWLRSHDCGYNDENQFGCQPECFELVRVIRSPDEEEADDSSDEEGGRKTDDANDTDHRLQYVLLQKVASIYDQSKTTIIAIDSCRGCQFESSAFAQAEAVMWRRIPQLKSVSFILL
jgi:hypothetical protein